MISALSFASGVSIEMYYSSSGSGAWVSDVYYALSDKYNYDTATYTNIINELFYTNLQTEMMETRPVELSIIGSAPYGHAIICDGYNGNIDTYHLNFGWGGASDGWFFLPTGMPSGYNCIVGAVVDIEGGTIPFDVSGLVYAEGAPLDETYITLDGTRFHEIFVDDLDGYFDIPILFPGEYEMTAIIELVGGGYFYKNEVVVLDEINNTLNIYLDNYETITGSVTASFNPENTHINIYQDGVLVSSGVADANGDYSIPGVLPGEYNATASLAGNYFDIQDVTISADNQIIDFQLEEYPYDFTFNFAGDPVGQLQLFQFMSCAIRLSDEDLIGYENNIFSQVEFIAPFDPDEGELYAQIWKNDSLFYEQQVDDFTEGEWIDVVYEDLFEIDVTAEYYIGYRIYSLSGNIAAVYHDAGPMVEGNGAYINISSWMPLPSTYNYNFCIKAVAASQNSSGNNNNLVPLVTTLNQNYPNPFNPTTTISYQLPEDGKVELAIYNLKGQKVKTLTNETLDSGNHTAVWNGRDDNNKSVSSGIYIYKMKTNDNEETKKMILLK